MPWGLGFCVVEDPSQMEANRTFSPGTFGHGGAFGTQSWADPVRGLVYVFMIERDKIPNNPDNSPMRRAPIKPPSKPPHALNPNSIL